MFLNSKNHRLFNLDTTCEDIFKEEISKFKNNNEEYVNNNNNENNCNCNSKKPINPTENMENKSLDEIYDYINKDNNKTKGKKRSKKNKAKNNSSNNYQNNYINNSSNNNLNNNNFGEIDYLNDPVVEEYKANICSKVRLNGSFAKIRPNISQEWIKMISSY